MLRMKLKQTSIAGAVLSILAAPSVALADNDANYFNVGIRAQLEAVNVSGDFAKSMGNDGFHLTDAWGNGNKNVSNFSGLSFEAGHKFDSGIDIFAKADFNFDTEGFKDNRAKYREQYVGIRGSYGEVRVGRLNTSYAMSGLGYDPLHATSLQSRVNGGRSGGPLGHGGFVDDGISYHTNLNGVKLDISYFKHDGSTHARSTYSVAAAVPLSDTFDLTLAHLTSQKAGGGKRDGTKVGGQYRVNQWTFSGQYEVRGKGLDNGDYAFFSTSYQAAVGKLTLNYGRFFDDSGAKVDSDYIAAALQRKLNNHFAYHAGLRYVDRDGLGSETIVAVGVRATWNKRLTW